MSQEDEQPQKKLDSHFIVQVVSPEMGYLALALPLFLWLSWSALYFQLPTFDFWQDIWEHAAAIKEWMKDLWNPGNPHLATDDSSARYMPYFLILAVSGKVFDLTALQLLGIGGVFNTAVFFLGIFLFFKTYFRNRWAPFVGLTIMIGGWGLAWVWSNCYQLRSLFYVNSYPSTFSFGFSLIAFWLATRILREEIHSLFYFGLLSFTIALLLLTHPVTGAFAIASLGILAVFEPLSLLKTRVKVIASIVLGAFVVEFWPYFSVWDLILGTSNPPKIPNAANFSHSWVQTSTSKLIDGISKGNWLRSDLHQFYDFRVFTTILGPSLLGFLVLIYIFYKKHDYFILIGFSVMLAPFLANIITPIPMGQRFLFYLTFYLHLACISAVLYIAPIWYQMLQNGKSSNIKAKIGLISISAIVGCSFVWNIILAVLMFAGYHPRLSFDAPHTLQPIARYSKLQPIPEDYTKIAHLLSEDAITLALPWHMWPLPTFQGKVIAVNHPNPFIADGSKRYDDSIRFFHPKTTYQDRNNIIRRYDISHIIFKDNIKGYAPVKDIYAFGDVIGRVKEYQIIKTSQNAREPRHLLNSDAGQ